MTVAQLLRRLSTEDPQALIVLSRDSEGNGYSPLFAIGSLMFVAEDGEVYDAEEDPNGEGGGKPAVVFWP